MPDDAVAARDQAVRALADHIQPTHCPGCPVCDTLWLLIAGAEYQIELALAGEAP